MGELAVLSGLLSLDREAAENAEEALELFGAEVSPAWKARLQPWLLPKGE